MDKKKIKNIYALCLLIFGIIFVVSIMIIGNNYSELQPILTKAMVVFCFFVPISLAIVHKIF